ncbi:hypothetical protein GKE82_05025 [Conexibacter sp. W3-3-2]|uniref:hypothetical protein n=1 Tax=Conexibacter sp. W3-3-2 TaxID=2675227 RepID=UPI0012B84B3D|nr:hypothetical protein [Conexibacter sp. W3-3-2]MTD43683.1 hypothetical protein [Conexibacter sp. W3-3-2]
MPLAVTLLPHDRGTSLVFLLVLAGAGLLIRSDSAEHSTTTIGIGLALLGVLAATVPGNAGEDGVPLLPGLLAVATAGALARAGTAAGWLAIGAMSAALLLVAIAPFDTSGFLSGDLPHPRERAFLTAGLGSLAALCTASFALGRRHSSQALRIIPAGIMAAAIAAYGYPVVVSLI